MEQKQQESLSIGEILNKAFFYWKKTLGYQIMFSLLYISLFISVFMYGLDYYGFFDDFVASINAISKGQDGLAEYAKIQEKMIADPNYQRFSWLRIAAASLLFPLHMGFYKMFRKIDLGEEAKSEDQFAGYLGVNFFIYSSYFLFWILVTDLLSKIFIGLAIIWIALTIFSAPLMFFKNIRVFESLTVNLRAWKNHFAVMLIASIIAVVIKLIGIFTFVGIIFVFGFSNAVIYALYREIFKEEPKNSA